VIENLPFEKLQNAITKFFRFFLFFYCFFLIFWVQKAKQRGSGDLSGKYD